MIINASHHHHNFADCTANSVIDGHSVTTTMPHCVPTTVTTPALGPIVQRALSRKVVLSLNAIELKKSHLGCVVMMVLPLLRFASSTCVPTNTIATVTTPEFGFVWESTALPNTSVAAIARDASALPPPLAAKLRRETAPLMRGCDSR